MIFLFARQPKDGRKEQQTDVISAVIDAWDSAEYPMSCNIEAQDLVTPWEPHMDDDAINLAVNHAGENIRRELDPNSIKQDRKEKGIWFNVSYEVKNLCSISLWQRNLILYRCVGVFVLCI